MATLRDTLRTTSGWMKEIFEFGVALILLFVVIDILFPGTTGVVNNIGEIVSNLASEGIVGLIALLIFLLIYKR